MTTTTPFTTNVPAIEITSQGLSVPLEADVLNGVFKDINAAFGGGLSENLETPQGQLASSFAAIIADKNNLMAELVNQVNPDYSDGAMQDAIARIYFLERKPATASVVACDLLGLAGTVVPAGFLAKDSSGRVWSLNQPVTIPAAGTASGQFSCSTTGPVVASAGTITEIYQSVVGLDRITNPQDATVGRDVESRADFAFRRQNSVAINAHGTPPAVYGEVFNLIGVLDAFVIDNVQDIPVAYGSTGYELKPHSIYCAVVGGDDAEIADAIWRKTGNGCNYNGNTPMILLDGTYSNPQPQYNISFMRPVAQPIYFEVRVENDRNVPATISADVKAAIVKAFSGSDGGSRARIGGHIHATRFVAAVIGAIGAAHFLGISVGTSSASLGEYVQIGIDQYPTISESQINISLVSL